MDNNYLSHEGVKGMRWGERRYQYKDGSLTPEGRRHYGYGEERNKLRSEIKIVREKARAERKMAAVKAREDRKMAKVQNAERIKYEKQRQRLEAKIQKTKNADKLKAEKSKEKQAARDARDQKRQIAEFKRKHPLQYRKIKPYLTKNGTLNDEGQTIFFGNGQKKTLAKMSNEDIRNATYRMNLKNRLNEQVATYNAHDPAAQRKETAKAVVGAGVISFVASFGLQSAADLVSGGTNEVKANLRNNGKKAAMAAIGAIGTTLTARLHLSGNKGKQAYNAFSNFKKNKDDPKDSNKSNKESNKRSKKSDAAWVNETGKKAAKRRLNKDAAKAREEHEYIKWSNERIRVENMVNRIVRTRQAQQVATNWSASQRTTRDAGIEALRNLGIDYNTTISNMYQPNIDIPEELLRR